MTSSVPTKSDNIIIIICHFYAVRRILAGRSVCNETKISSCRIVPRSVVAIGIKVRLKIKRCLSLVSQSTDQKGIYGFKTADGLDGNPRDSIEFVRRISKKHASK